MKLRGKVVLITGASRGMGKATALLFAKEGAKVVVNFVKSEEKANEVVDQIKKLGSDAIAVKADVSKSKDVSSMVEKAMMKFGRIDVLVNNAGMTIVKPYAQLTSSDWEEILRINLIGTFLCCQAVSKIMLEQKSGTIVNISSTAGLTGSVSSVAYGAAKAGVINITREFAKELAPNIRVNAVAPGITETDFLKFMTKERIAVLVNSSRLKRLGQPEDVAKAVLFLATDDSSYVTGQTLFVDGGFTL
ncbi:MAG: 3-oxoacyl-ACP reductase family protein [Candidatus Micrarchaeota archaeon]